jgi:isopenicillin-N epimerase
MPITPQNVSTPPSPLAADCKSQWMLRPDVDYLNHGCFGARPKVVHDALVRWTERFEREPLDSLERDRSPSLASVRGRLASFLRVQPDDLGMVTNATAGVNAVLRSLRWRPGQEILTINHVYNAVRLSMRWMARQFGVTIRELPIPLPVRSPADVIKLVVEGLSPHTQLLIIDHITSPTALVLPVKEIVAACSERGIDVLIDGAHAPGMIDLNIAELDSAYYVGNLHKWVCAPVGAGFLWVRPDRQHDIRPLILSHFNEDGFTQAFTWQGTQNIGPWLCVADALDYFDRFGWTRVREHNHAMALWVQQFLTQRWGMEPISPADGSMIGSMVSLRLPAELQAFAKPEDLVVLLREQHRIEVPVFDWHGTRLIRPSCQIYNSPDQYKRLADVIDSLRRSGRSEAARLHESRLARSASSR